ncbi:MAG: sigma-70 family RNA polymerase sigma factor [Ignavibacteriae bacterium]|nr:sigma-70 family RNA polymerase sigma factor [Ignavibacteriota bacterium]NOG97993.1 sigma-70 family RNA polymerase sigma factor [Ignavibacteriota bacterium]
MHNSEYDKLNDSELTAAIKVGNKNAFKDLYYKYFDKLYSFAWYRTYSEETSRDFVQELFTILWTHRKKLDPNKSIKAYLYKVLGNLIIDASRLHSSQNISLENIESTSYENDMELNIDIQNAIARLPKKLKEVYLLSRLDGFKYSEIAEILGISIKAVEKRLTKAFGILRKTFPEKYFS